MMMPILQRVRRRTVRAVREVDFRFAGLTRSRQLGTSLSDNERYPNACTEAANDARLFSVFRRNPDYVEVLEHVSRKSGQDYLAEIENSSSELLAHAEEFRENDRWGSPRTYDYGHIGRFSPTTLRYIKVLGDLRRHFGSLRGLTICEIGIGYGGQCRVIDVAERPTRYLLVDLKPVLRLSQAYLDKFPLTSTVEYLTMNELTQRSVDLVISNYAFTELPRSIQEVYVERIVKHAARGYITYNNINPAEFNSYTREELLALMPGAVVEPEVPLTSPENCVITWGSRRASGNRA